MFPTKKIKFDLTREPLPSGWAVGAYVDWGMIRRCWEAGAAEWWLRHRWCIDGRELGLRSEGWDVCRREAVVRRRMGVPVVEGVDWAGYTSVEMWVDGLCQSEVGDGFPLAEAAEALDAMARGVPFSLACEASGLAPETVTGWRRRHPKVDALFTRARAMSAKPLAEKIMRSEDWRAAAWMLERNVGKEVFRQESVPEKLVIEINVSRDQQIARDNGVIDVTPEPVDAKVVSQLPAKR